MRRTPEIGSFPIGYIALPQYNITIIQVNHQGNCGCSSVININNGLEKEMHGHPLDARLILLLSLLCLPSHIINKYITLPFQTLNHESNCDAWFILFLLST